MPKLEAGVVRQTPVADALLPIVVDHRENEFVPVLAANP